MIARLAIPGAWMWSAWQPERGMAFNSYYFEGPGGGVAVDPLALDDGGLQRLRDLGGVKTVIVTNRDHVRASRELAGAFGASIVETAADGEELFPGAFALRIERGKSPEFAIHLREHAAAVVGDALIGAPAGALSLLPDDKLADPQSLIFELRRLWALELRALLLCDGAPLLRGADKAIGDLLYARAGSEIFRINVDELQFVRDEPYGKYDVNDGEVGLLIGARKVGYRVSDLEPGTAFCPLHWHVEDEEFFYVLEGRPSIRTLTGTIQCRPGDFIAFPTGERGAHQLVNDSSARARVLLVGGNPPLEVCFYPDSRKVLVDEPGGVRLMVRAEPDLPYFDGE